MKGLIAILAVILVSSPCCTKPAESENLSVVSVYTTLPSTSGTGGPLDVYHQIANNIAEKITSPFYRFLGFNRSSTAENKTTTTQVWSKIELLDDDEPLEINKTDIKPVDNDISDTRDVEELSVEALKRDDKKPEKIILYSSRYLPAKAELNEEVTTNKNDEDDFFFDFDEDKEKANGNSFANAWEWVVNVLAAAWETMKSLFQVISGSGDAA